MSLYKVLVNCNEEYSILPIEIENPSGWRDIKSAVPKEECITYIENRHLLGDMIRQINLQHESCLCPFAPWSTSVLKTAEEIDAAVEQVYQLGLPIVDDKCKNWDTLAALYLILKKTKPDAKIFDAGGELYSMILPWLAIYGYRDLVAGNLVFSKEIKKGPIHYKYADICQTDFHPNTFDVVTCLSVIEHGVELITYFQEMARILKPRGLLVISTDYYETPVDTKDQVAYGVSIHIFNKNEIIQVLELAKQCGFQLLSQIDLTTAEKPIHWKEYGLSYTFVLLSFQKCE